MLSNDEDLPQRSNTRVSFLDKQLLLRQNDAGNLKSLGQEVKVLKDENSKLSKQNQELLLSVELQNDRMTMLQ